MTVMQMLPGLVHYLDCMRVVKAWAKGQVWCTSSKRPGADLWRSIWHVIGEYRTDEFQVKWCKGHATEDHIARGITTPKLKLVNDSVDVYANSGTDIAEDMSPCEDQQTCYNLARRWYKWVAKLTVSCPQMFKPKLW